MVSWRLGESEAMRPAHSSLVEQLHNMSVNADALYTPRGSGLAMTYTPRGSGLAMTHFDSKSHQDFN